MTIENYKDVLKNRTIEFETEKKAINWLKKNNVVCIKVGMSYFIEPDQFDVAFDKYLKNQLSLKRKQSARARKNFKKSPSSAS